MGPPPSQVWVGTSRVVDRNRDLPPRPLKLNESPVGLSVTTAGNAGSEAPDDLPVNLSASHKPSDPGPTPSVPRLEWTSTCRRGRLFPVGHKRRYLDHELTESNGRPTGVLVQLGKVCRVGVPSNPDPFIVCPGTDDPHPSHWEPLTRECGRGG